MSVVISENPPPTFVCDTTDPSMANLYACQYAYTVGVCNAGDYQGWMDIFYCIDPNFWAFMGLGITLGASIFGAAW